jgi:pyruvate,water dikinase
VARVRAGDRSIIPIVTGTLYSLQTLADRPRPAAEVGGKAFHLAQLVAAGLPVPDGFAIAAQAEAKAVGRAELERAAAPLGEPLAVRSSASVEDGVERAAPGLFATRLDVRAAELTEAVAEVLASAGGPAVAAYLGGAPPPAMAVVVQRQVSGVGGVLYTRPPAGPDADAMWIESGSRRAVVDRDGAPREVDADFPLDGAKLIELARLGVAAERAIGASRERGADVEWIAGGDRLWLVQARPRTGPLPGARAEDPAIAAALAFSRGDARTWQWDAAHNPDPLSPAQAGLVDLVADLGDEEMRLVGGYLYTAPRPGKRSAVDGDVDVVELFTARAAPAMERALEPVERDEPPALGDALAAYRSVYAVYTGELTPALRRARAASGAPASAPSSSAVAGSLAGGAAAALAPAWDVAAPAFDETGEVARARSRLAGRDHTALSDGDRIAEIAEADDLYFFRAQRAVRRALLALAARWGIAANDDAIFYLPLALVRRHADGATRPTDDELAAARAARARRAEERARAMPLAFSDGRRRDPLVAPNAPDLWRGRAAGGGSARGPVAIVGDLGHLDRDPRGCVVAASSVTPAALVQLAGALALVCEHGGALGHAAALARELGMPCVVGCAGITRELKPGDQLLVDGDAGLVVRVGRDDD